MKGILFIIIVGSGALLADAIAGAGYPDQPRASWHALVHMAVSPGGQALDDNEPDPIYIDQGLWLNAGFALNMPAWYLQWENTLGVILNQNDNFSNVSFPIESSAFIKPWANLSIGGGIKFVPEREIDYNGGANFFRVESALGFILEARYRNWDRNSASSGFFVSLKAQIIDYTISSEFLTSNEDAVLNGNTLAFGVGLLY